jgi:phage shock protein PspC (stress-responsive transcriptional regulator)
MNTQASSPSSGTDPGGSPAGQAGAPGAGHGAPHGEQFFDRIRALGVVRPDEGRWAAGVCAGLARRWGLDPLLVRGLFIVVGIVGGFGLGLYGLLWLFLPHPDGRIHAQQLLRGVVTAGFVGSVLFVLVDLPFSGPWGWNRSGHPFGGIAFLALIGLAVWWLVTKDSRKRGGPTGPSGPAGGPGSTFGGPGFGGPGSTFGGPGHDQGPAGTPAPGAPTYGTPPPEGPRPGGPDTETSQYGGYPVSGTAYAPGSTTSSTGYPPSGGYATGGYAPSSTYTPVVTPQRPVDVHRPLHALTLTTFGVALVAAGAVLGWDRWISGIADAGFVATAVGLGVIALGIVVAGLAGRRSGALAPIAILLAILTAAGASAQDSVRSAKDTQNWTPATAVVATSGYNLSTGRAVLDLTQPGLTTGATTAAPVTVPASIGAGELVVIVPTGVSTRVQATVGLGDVTNRLDGVSDNGGPNINETITSGTNPVLVVNAKVGLGHIEVVRQGTEVTR